MRIILKPQHYSTSIKTFFCFTLNHLPSLNSTLELLHCSDQFIICINFNVITTQNVEKFLLLTFKFYFQTVPLDEKGE